MSESHTVVKLLIPDGLKSYIAREIQPILVTMNTEMVFINELYIIRLRNILQSARMERFLDSLRKKHSSIRYHIFIYDSVSNWPKSIRINTQGNKVITARQSSFNGV